VKPEIEANSGKPSGTKTPEFTNVKREFGCAMCSFYFRLDNMEFMTSISFKVINTAPKSTADSITVYAVGTEDKDLKLQGSGAKLVGLKSLNLKALGVSGAYEANSRVSVGKDVVGLIGIASGCENSNY
jgi:hypothetical protein